MICNLIIHWIFFQKWNLKFQWQCIFLLWISEVMFLILGRGVDIFKWNSYPKHKVLKVSLCWFRDEDLFQRFPACSIWITYGRQALYKVLLSYLTIFKYPEVSFKTHIFLSFLKKRKHSNTKRVFHALAIMRVFLALCNYARSEWAAAWITNSLADTIHTISYC